MISDKEMVDMIFEFGNQFNIHDVSIEVETDGQVQYHNMQAPEIMIVQQFLSLIQQAVNTNIPVRITMATMVPVYSDKITEYRNMKSTLEFKNDAYLDKVNV